MKRFILTFTFLSLLTQLNAQTNSSNKSGMDSLKKSIRNLGNLFKKAGSVTITINGIENKDNNLIAFVQNIQRVTGVKKITESYKANSAVFDVSYKGKASDLWQDVPQNSKQVFSIVSLSDTAINLNYKYATTASAPPQNNASPSAAANKTQNNTLVSPDQPSKGAALLFKNVKSKLPDETRNTIFSTLGFKVAKD
jgi:hypothetical protein